MGVFPGLAVMVPREVHFDASIGAWIVSRFADVSAALHHPQIAASGTTVVGDMTHRVVRDATARALSTERLAQWRQSMEIDANRLVDAFVEGEPVDLVRSFAQPWSLGIARVVTGTSCAAAAQGAPLARDLFLAAARASDGAPEAAALQAATRLARLLQRDNAHAGAVADVQVFVALSQTLPCLLAGAWLALLQHPEQLMRLRQDLPSMTQGVEELLRFASPSRAVFRSALDNVEIGGAHIQRGDRIVLMLSAANHDPARFPEPDRLDLGRTIGGHLAFGTGAHACAGAALVRVAVAVATEALIGRTAAIELVGGEGAKIEWVGGFAIFAPGNLQVRLRLS